MTSLAASTLLKIERASVALYGTELDDNFDVPTPSQMPKDCNPRA